ncbi:MAG TPA: ferritin-like domain-containing protein [Polyangiaceae bacterium]|nr:ferritin-like domain-containing protein [Polyangiaceae bacterium]
MTAAMLDLHTEARALAVSVPDLPHLYASARATWLGRMVNEHASARVFEGLALQMEEAGLERSLVKSCRTFAQEERTHGALCGAVVEALGGRAEARARQEEAFPMHRTVAPIEGVLRNLLSISCLSETVAVSLIGAERLEMPAGPLRELLTRIWADEFGHARFGWKVVPDLLPRLTKTERERLGTYLAVAFAHLERHELAHLAPVRPPPEGAALGLCSGVDARALFYATVHDVIVPSLDALGLRASHAWAHRAA